MENEDENYEDMDEVTREKLFEEQKKAQIAMIEAQKKKDAYTQELKEKTLQTFEDVPDEVSKIYVDSQHADQVSLSFEAPDCNNSAITEFRVYLSSRELTNIGTSQMRC